MKKLKGWKYDLKNNVYVQNDFSIGQLDDQLGTDQHGDVKNRQNYDPNFCRWNNSFEMAQHVRFATVMTWIRSRLSYIGELEGKKRKKVLIDLGCSRSFIYRRWKGNMNFWGWPLLHYWGVDSSLKRINEGRKEFVKKKNDSLVYFVGDLNKFMKFPGKADIIICLETLEHIPEENVRNLFNTFRFNLRENGLVIMSSPNPKEEDGWVWGEESKGSHHKEYTWEEAKILFSKNRFEVVDHTGVLPYRNYHHKSSFGKLRSELVKHFPSAWINNILLLAEPDMKMKQQWLCSLRKK